MREHKVRHPEERNQTVGRSKVLPELNLSGLAVWRGRLWNGQGDVLHCVMNLVGLQGSSRSAGSRHGPFPASRGVDIFRPAVADGRLKVGGQQGRNPFGAAHPSARTVAELGLRLFEQAWIAQQVDESRGDDRRSLAP